MRKRQFFYVQTQYITHNENLKFVVYTESTSDQRQKKSISNTSSVLSPLILFLLNSGI